MSHFHRTAPHQEQAPATQGKVLHWAGHYDLFASVLTFGRRGQLRRETVELAALQPGSQVLEVGCGTGDVALAATRQVGASGAVYGIDPSPEMIAVAREKAARAGLALNFQIGVIEALAFPDDSFDMVFSSLMMHHLPDELKRRGLAEVARVLKPRGRLLIVDIRRPVTRWERIKTRISLHGSLREGVQDLSQLLRAAGFSDVQMGNMRFGMLGYVLGQIAK